MGKVSMSYLFSFSGYQTKCVIEFLFRELMKYEFYDLSLIALQSSSQQVQKEGRTEIQTIEYLENEKSFRRNKNNFS